MESIETLLTFTEETVYAATGEHLSDLQRLILQELWQNNKKTYGQIAIEHSYSGNYIQQVAAPRLWRLLSQVFGQKVTKSNVRRVLEQQVATPTITNSISLSVDTDNDTDYSGDRLQKHLSPLQHDIPPQQGLEHPTGSVPLYSSFYVSRPQDPLCYQNILQPQSLIQIKAPRQMGKTSLVNRILDQAATVGYRSAIVNFQQADRSTLSDLSKLLRWICTCISHQLDQESQVASYWDEELGHKISCTLYLDEQVLKLSEVPIMLVLEEASELFEHPLVAQDVLTMIRTWHELMKQSETWQKLRLVMVYATEVDLPLHTSQLPFNVGLEVTLPPFTRAQVEDLVQRHELELSPDQVTQLMKSTKGYPSLVRSTLYALARQEIALETICCDTVSSEICRDRSN